MTSVLCKFQIRKQLTLPSGVKGKWIDAGANERLDTYYNSGKCPQMIMNKFSDYFICQKIKVI